MEQELLYRTIGILVINLLLLAGLGFILWKIRCFRKEIIRFEQRAEEIESHVTKKEERMEWSRKYFDIHYSTYLRILGEFGAHPDIIKRGLSTKLKIRFLEHFQVLSSYPIDAEKIDWTYLGIYMRFHDRNTHFFSRKFGKSVHWVKKRNAEIYHLFGFRVDDRSPKKEATLDLMRKLITELTERERRSEG